jgi:hypothetical protein
MTPRLAPVCVALLVTALCAPTAGARVHRFPAAGLKSGKLVFPLRGVKARTVVAASVDRGAVGRGAHRRGARVRLSTRRVRRAMRRGRLTVGLRRLHLRRAFHGRRFATVRRKPKVIVTTDTTPPDTAITSSPPSSTTSTDATFAFTATESAARFDCRLDGASWTACVPPKAYSSLPAGSHAFGVRAIDAAGNVDSTPAGVTWIVEAAAPPAPPPPVAGCATATDWVAPQLQQTSASYLYTPLSDGEAALCVTRTPEAVPANVIANSYVPSDAELAAFHAAIHANGETQEEAAWYPRYVTGRPRLVNPSTDDLIEWAARKWGIPEDWLRAQYTHESGWNQAARGDRRTVSADCYLQHPQAARIAGTSDVYESLGITQLKWRCGNAEGAGTEPLRWTSTAFNVDFQASIVRFYYDNPYGKRSSWGDSAYKPLDKWGAIGAWFSPYPYNNTGALAYIDKVHQHLAGRDWPY